jgi:hypothetical protein
LECDFSNECTPKISCGEWSSCEVDYDFMDLLDGGLNKLRGTRSRICEDNNLCNDPVLETQVCSTSVDIYTRKFSQCGSEFVGVYNRLTNELLARIEKGDEEKPFLNVHLDGGLGESDYCDYCFDGVLNGDEGGVDCGGGCMSCEDKYPQVQFKKRTIFRKFINWFKGLLI